MYSWLWTKRPVMFWYSGLSRIRRAVAASGAWRRTRPSHACLVSSIAAHSSPRGATPASWNAASGTRVAALPRPSSPSASASRRAGSTVSTSTLPPWCTAAMAAAAAAVVVLPTPPEPHAIDDLVGGEQLLEWTGAWRRPPRHQNPSSAASDSATTRVERRPDVPGEQVRARTAAAARVDRGAQALEVGSPAPPQRHRQAGAGQEGLEVAARRRH